MLDVCFSFNFQNQTNYNLGLDPDVRHIVSEQDQEVISIADALERGLLTPDGRIKLDLTEGAGAHGRQLDLYDAQRQGLLIRRIRHTIFDVKGIRNTENNANLSFNEAVEAGILQVNTESYFEIVFII